MSPRTGRPKSDNPKTIRYSGCIDAKLEERLEKHCLKHGITKGEAIRKAVIEYLDKK